MKDSTRTKARRRVITSFVLVMCFAIIFIGVAAYFLSQRNSGIEISNRMVNATKICVLSGVFLLIMDFGYILPRLFKKDRYADDNVMRQALTKYIPDGESVEAGIYATAIESYVNVVYRKCRYENDKLLVDDEADVFSMEKRKYCEHKIYIGVTQSAFLFVECENNKHYYEYNTEVKCPYESIPELNKDIDVREVGIVFNKTDIEKCEVKRAKKGNKLCTVTMKNGTYFKILIADNAGPTSNMPNHAEYSKKILNMMNK